MIIKREKAFLISFQILLWQLLKILSRNVCRSVWRICMLILRIWGMHGKWWLFIWNSPHEVTWVFDLGRLLSFLLLFFSLLSCKKKINQSNSCYGYFHYVLNSLGSCKVFGVIFVFVSYLQSVLPPWVGGREGNRILFYARERGVGG